MYLERVEFVHFKSSVKVGDFNFFLVINIILTYKKVYFNSIIDLQ